MASCRGTKLAASLVDQEVLNICQVYLTIPRSTVCSISTGVSRCGSRPYHRVRHYYGTRLILTWHCKKGIEGLICLCLQPDLESSNRLSLGKPLCPTAELSRFVNQLLNPVLGEGILDTRLGLPLINMSLHAGHCSSELSLDFRKCCVRSAQSLRLWKYSNDNHPGMYRQMSHLKMLSVPFGGLFVLAVTAAFTVSAEAIAVQPDVATLLRLLRIIAWSTDHDVSDKTLFTAMGIVCLHRFGMRFPATAE